MPRTATIIQVFVASPSDVYAERNLLEALIRELNQIWSSTLNIVFELTRWETNVRPALGEDPQAVISQQIGDAYDVFIGIIWGRFGSPTPRASSGTLEEFNRAVARRTAEGDSPEIMVYFKDAPIPPSQIDPDQIAKIQAFRRSLSAQGGLYGVFEDEDGFQTSLRAHLASLAQKFANTSFGARHLVAHPIEGSPAVESPADDLGYLDYIETYVAKVEEMTRALDVINDATVRVGHHLSQRTEEILSAPESHGEPKTMRRLIKRAADDMESYAVTMAGQIPLLTSSREAAMSSLTAALALYEEFSVGTNDLPSLRDSLGILYETSLTSKQSVGGFRDSVRALPRMTSEINRAKRAVMLQLDSMLQEMEKTANTISNVLSAIDRMLERIGGSEGATLEC